MSTNCFSRKALTPRRAKSWPARAAAGETCKQFLLRDGRKKRFAAARSSKAPGETPSLARRASKRAISKLAPWGWYGQAAPGASSGL